MSADDRIRPIGRPGDAKPPEKPAAPAPPPQAPAPPAQAPKGPGTTPVREPRLTPPAMSPQPTPPPPPSPPSPPPQPKPAPEATQPAREKSAPPPPPPAAALPPPPPPPSLPPLAVTARSSPAAKLKWALWMALGIAVTAGAGYLVAALWLFPAPLLPNERQVARVSGLREADARRALERQSLGIEVTGREPSPNITEGAVIWQDPPPGVAVPRGTSVKVILSAGLPVVAVPDVRGFDPEFAMRLIAAAGLRVEGIDTTDVKGVPSGAAGGTSPAAGDSVLIGRAIILHLAP